MDVFDGTHGTLIIYKSEITLYNATDASHNVGEEKDKYNFVNPSVASDWVREPGPSSGDGVGKWMGGTSVKCLKSSRTHERREVCEILLVQVLTLTGL